MQILVMHRCIILYYLQKQCIPNLADFVPVPVRELDSESFTSESLIMRSLSGHAPRTRTPHWPQPERHTGPLCGQTHWPSVRGPGRPDTLAQCARPGQAPGPGPGWAHAVKQTHWQTHAGMAPGTPRPPAGASRHHDLWFARVTSPGRET